MRYKINWMEVKQTSTGKTKADCSLIDESGIEIDKVSIWSDFPDFANLKPGSEVNGDLVKAKDPKYGPTLYPAKTYKTFAAKPKVDIGKMMEKKEASIGRFQDNKEESIKISGAQRDATLMVTTFYPVDMDTDALKKYWKEWKDFFINQYEQPF